MIRKRPIEERLRNCVMCGAAVTIRSTTSPHAEAPEMLAVPPKAWIGFVQGDHAPEMIVCCSEAHVMRLLEEG